MMPCFVSHVFLTVRLETLPQDDCWVRLLNEYVLLFRSVRAASVVVRGLGSGDMDTHVLRIVPLARTLFLISVRVFMLWYSVQSMVIPRVRCSGARGFDGISSLRQAPALKLKSTPRRYVALFRARLAFFVCPLPSFHGHPQSTRHGIRNITDCCTQTIPENLQITYCRPMYPCRSRCKFTCTAQVSATIMNFDHHR